MKKEKQRKNCFKSYVTPEEHERIKRAAKRCGLSVSEYARRIITGYHVNSHLDQEAFLAALKVNADLGRLGGLFKYYISQEFYQVHPEEVRKLLREVEALQKQLRPIIKKINKLF